MRRRRRSGRRRKKGQQPLAYFAGPIHFTSLHSAHSCTWNPSLPRESSMTNCERSSDTEKEETMKKKKNLEKCMFSFRDSWQVPMRSANWASEYGKETKKEERTGAGAEFGSKRCYLYISTYTRTCYVHICLPEAHIPYLPSMHPCMCTSSTLKRAKRCHRMNSFRGERSKTAKRGQMLGRGRTFEGL